MGELKHWVAECSSCGQVNLRQKCKPSSCKELVRTGPRSTRRCANVLTDQRDVTAQVLASGQKVFAICRIDGVVELRPQHPGDGYFALAVGDPGVVREVFRKTGVAHGAFGVRVPGTRNEATDRENLSNIASYIQVLDKHNAPGFRALGA